MLFFNSYILLISEKLLKKIEARDKDAILWFILGLSFYLVLKENVSEAQRAGNQNACSCGNFAVIKFQLKCHCPASTTIVN